MDLSELGYTFTGMPSVEIMDESKEDLSVIDLGFGNLSVSPTRFECSFGGTDGSSTSMVMPEVSDADHLLSAFNSISIAKPIEITDDETNDFLKADALEYIHNTDLSEQKHDMGNGTGKLDLVDLPTVCKPSTEAGTDGVDLVGFDSKSKVNHPLILYTSARRNTRGLKLNQNNDSKERPSKCRRMARKRTVVDVSSLQILRKNRSSVPKPRSSVWGGCLENALPCSRDHGVLSLNLGNEKNEKRVRGGKGKKNPVKGQIHKESIENNCPPAGRISLKIRIGNKLCSMGNASESCLLQGKRTAEALDIKENMLEEKILGFPLERNLEKGPSDAYALNKPPAGKTAYDNSCFSTSSDFHSIIALRECDNLAVSDIGTSPDSEVINTVPDVPLYAKGLLDLETSPVVSNASASPSDNSILVLSPRKSKKGVKNDKLHCEGNCALEVMLTGEESSNKDPLCVGDASSMRVPQSKFKKGNERAKMNELGGSGVKCSEETGNEAEVAADLEMDPNLSDPRVNSSKTSLDCPDLSGGIGPLNAEVCDIIPCSKGQKTSKSARAKRGSKSRSKILHLSSKKDKSSKKKGNKDGAGGGRHTTNETPGADDALSKVESLHTTGNQTPIDLIEIEAPSSDSTDPLDNLPFSSDGAMEQSMPLSGWVMCDECKKWRRIPATLCDLIEETNPRWACRENPDINYADCSIPQEKSDSAINEELGISETSWEEDDGGTLQNSIENRLKASQLSSWSLIKSNLFLHRSRKKQTIDEVMVCHCKPSLDGRLGCGAKCLNRMLNIECVEGTCPCGEACSNQQFQKRNYSKLKWFKCGKKGYGLQALEDISKGQFLIEYVGEVLDVRAYEARQREYALNGHRHFYFMTLNGSEVIDACAKGNLGRFINHSCDPNCRTEKWMVNGEVCIGLFSIRNIKKGEEVTFDYNYVRVFGAAAKKCVCGSPNCRGYIGGDPTNSEVIVQDDSDDEYTEPVMICEDRELNEEWNDIISSSLKSEENEFMLEQTENRCNMEKRLGSVGETFAGSQALDSLTPKVEDPAQVAGTVVEVDNSFGNGLVEQSEINKECGKSLNGSVIGNLKAKSDDLQSRMSSSELMHISLDTDGSLNKELSSAHESVVTVASPSKSPSDAVESKRKLKYATVGVRDGVSKSKPVARTKRYSNSVRKGKPKVNAMNDKESSDMDKINGTLHKAKKLAGLSISHFEAVEEKLNELLDPEGGISRRKDASKGYLKLLYLTVASGNSAHGEAIQSNRDLSMILDALLKTKSRSVLIDIINKNGLQMLHNIMKRYRKEFIKTPILRKLLKVLEHLALRQILTLEHITGGPPCPGLESFKDSILSLTEHADKQVHQIARSFRDRWIPRHLRKGCCIERDNGRNEFNQHSSHLSTLNNHKSDLDGKPSVATISCEKHPVAAPVKVETSTLDSSAGGANVTKTRKRKSRWDNPVAENPHSRTSPKLAGDEQRSLDEDIPPGFSSSCNGHPIPSNVVSATTNHKEMGMHKLQNPCDVILGCSPVRFNARMPVSYGISRSLVQKFGVTQMESSDCWAIAPGVPFLPFPPLPSHPRSSGELPAAPARCAQVSELTENPEHNDTSVILHAGQKRNRTCSIDLPDSNVSVPNSEPDFQQGNGLGRKYFRQQKWNHSKLAPPWVRMRNGWGYAGNNPQNNPPGVGYGVGANGVRNVCNWQETNWRG